MQPIQLMIAPKGVKHRPAHPMTPRFITIHETGNPSKGAGALAHGKILLSRSRKENTAWHYCVDDQNIVQSIPDNENCWHAGDGTNGRGNRESIGIEICINPESIRLNAIKNTIDLVVSLMKKYQIPLENVVQHNHWNGKNCPMQIRAGHPINWATFIKATEHALKPSLIYTCQLGYFREAGNAETMLIEVKKKNIDAKIVLKEV
jgi:N-acetylmuramoyl-L-alanine amidase